MVSTYFIVSLGCAKNSVDSSSIGYLLEQAGCHQVETSKKADIIIVNTCGFIQSAREESIQVIKHLALSKRRNQILIAAGCMMELYTDQIFQNVIGVNGVLSAKRWLDVVSLINHINSSTNSRRLTFDDSAKHRYDSIPRFVIQGGSSYLKIAEGCHRSCAFCTIPFIRGPFESRPVKQVLDDTCYLNDHNIKEINVIAQDTTAYGTDIGIDKGIEQLLLSIVLSAPNVPWIRLLYAYPGFRSDALIETIAANPQIVHYLDIPLQHAHPDVLKMMNRPSNMNWVIKMLDDFRRKIPDMVFRSTFIVGYPGEGEREFRTLIDFVKMMRFDHIGVFPYSFETGTPGEHFQDPIPLAVKLARRDTLMQIQQEISGEIHETLIGSEMEILVEGVENDIVIGRSYRDAPEVDGLVFAEGKAEIGSMTKVRIEHAMPYDLVGRVVD